MGREIQDILSDEESIRVYKLLLEAQCHRGAEQYWFYKQAKSPGEDYFHFTMKDGYQVFGRKNMYFHNTFQKFSEDEVLLDAGAFNGDTIQEFYHATNGKYKKIYALEPDKKNFHELEKRMLGFVENSKFKIFQCGIGGETKKTRFQSGGTSARVSDSGDTEIQLYHADEFINMLENTPTFIKMDIEGQEYESLCAMAEYLRQNKPSMAISIYHKPEDLYRIPLFIHEQMPNARLYIRHNTNAFTETILYVNAS